MKRGESQTSQSQPKQQKPEQDGTGYCNNSTTVLWTQDIDDMTLTTAEWIKYTNKECCVTQTVTGAAQKVEL